MILPTMVLPSRQNLHCTESGLDSAQECIDREYFKSYPYRVEYRYNSRGFRDNEWPQEHKLPNSVWCVGDSFTAGIGLAEGHTWPQQLEKSLMRRCINISLDGASNQWIARRSKEILEVIKPKVMCIHWSYLHRWESADASLSDEDRRVFSNPCQIEHNYYKEFNNLTQSINQCQGTTKVIHSIIPNSWFITPRNAQEHWDRIKGIDWPTIPPASLRDFYNLPRHIVDELVSMSAFDYVEYYAMLQEFSQYNPAINAIIEVEQIDYARDHFHYGTETVKNFVTMLTKLITS